MALRDALPPPRVDEHAPLVLLEGHVRLTAYFLQPECIPPSLPVIVGYVEGMVK
jgi:hypothetical protein